MLIEELRRDIPDTKLMILEPFVLPGCKTDNNEEHPHRWEFFRDEVALRAQVAKRIAEKYDIPFIPLQETFNAANADAPATYAGFLKYSTLNVGEANIASPTHIGTTKSNENL